ncbi:MAG: DUF222 domain-containing protein [Nocardioidaceae bacterium]
MFDTRVDGLDADETLTRAGQLRALACRAEVALIGTAAHWADLNGALDGAGAVSVGLPGAQGLVEFGGDGTPGVCEFAPAELGAELGMSVYAATALIADALDLRHRLPAVWAKMQAGDIRPWVGRRTAELSRHLPVAAVGVVDRRVARYGCSLTWGRLGKVVQAAVVEADPALAAAAAADRRTDHGVWLARSTDLGTRAATIVADARDLLWFDASIDRIADGIGLLGDPGTKDARRAKAVGILADPQRTLDLYTHVADTTRHLPPTDLPHEVTAEPARRRVDPRPPATLYIHLSRDAITGVGAAVARVEDIGPVTADQAKQWLGDCHVTIKPVIDLAAVAPVDAYEIPDRIREAVHLLTPADVFPYATATRRRIDIDHTDPYLPPNDGGPPDQTRIGNLGPITRRHHRIKTHSRWRLQQPYPGIYLWRSPHGRYYLVDHTGTHKLPRTA